MKSGRMHCVFDSRGERGKGRGGKQALQKRRIYFCCHHCGAGRGREAGPGGADLTVGSEPYPPPWLIPGGHTRTLRT